MLPQLEALECVGETKLSEPTAEVPPDAERRNFCGSFALLAPKVEEVIAPKLDALTAKQRLEALFKK